MFLAWTADPCHLLIETVNTAVTFRTYLPSLFTLCQIVFVVYIVFVNCHSIWCYVSFNDLLVLLQVNKPRILRLFLF